MPRSDRSESGFLVLADISGFTAFVTATEPEPRTYVLFTGAAVERLHIGPDAIGMTRYTGKYAHFDEVEYFVVSLDRFAGRREGVGPEMLVGLRSLLGDLALGADPRAEHDLRPVVAA